MNPRKTQQLIEDLVCRMMMGKVVRASLYYDTGALLHQLGLAP
jgi:hypothetical protein